MGACYEDIILLTGKWNLNIYNEDNFAGIKFFQNKIPNNFMGCNLIIDAIGPEPYVIKENFTLRDGEDSFVLRGIGLEMVVLFGKEKNFTLVFLEPSAVMQINEIKLKALTLVTHNSDILGGLLPRIYPLTHSVDMPDPVLFDYLKLIVPCPRPIAKIKRVMTLFSLSTWLSIGIVFILVSVLFWALKNMLAFTKFSVLGQSFSDAWAVLLGISVPQMPVSLEIRYLFILYVWYCFAISMVFQAFFTTYLVEPGYEAGFKTLEDVEVSGGMKFGSYDIVIFLREYVYLEDLMGFEEEMCTDINICVSRVMFGKEIFSIIVSYFPTYLASLSGIHETSKVICFLDSSIMTLPIGIAVSRGSPLRDMLNVHMRRCLEGGLLNNYWSALKHTVNLRADTHEEHSEYVVFSINHLGPAFLLLFFGHILSVLVFILEFIFKLISFKKNRVF
ncbi:hypothetical protein L9F63_025852 [Diploptera punctata]|uniref:Uncharacterized protein n=1 Tax=Diploptera punctata TaxID=6984 RepID=A0AAD7Z6P2_DIPPU|nr:hypothetical protein L9F63_025852 [Diploptera punctata]